ncbi:MAG TPA: hypothetical protein VFZ70_16285 [Euzebyales bacterium]
MTASPHEPLAHVWGGVWAGGSDDRVGAFEGVLAGVLVVGRKSRPAAARPTPVHGATGPAIASVIRQLPPTAASFAWLADTTPSMAALLAMCERLPGHDAVIVARPVSDAVKRVDRGMVVAGVDRGGLCRPGPPLLIRAATARDLVAPALAAGREMIAALAASGCSVAVMEPAELDVA